MYRSWVKYWAVCKPMCMYDLRRDFRCGLLPGNGVFDWMDWEKFKDLWYFWNSQCERSAWNHRWIGRCNRYCSIVHDSLRCFRTTSLLVKAWREDYWLNGGIPSIGDIFNSDIFIFSRNVYGLGDYWVLQHWSKVFLHGQHLLWDSSRIRESWVKTDRSHKKEAIFYGREFPWV